MTRYLLSWSIFASTLAWGAGPEVHVWKRKAKDDKDYLLLRVIGDRTNPVTLESGQGRAILTVQPRDGGDTLNCNRVPVEVKQVAAVHNGAVVELDSVAISCLAAAAKDSAKYLAPTVLLPKLTYKGKAVEPTAVAVLNILTIDENEDLSLIEASRLAFTVRYRPWTTPEAKEKVQQNFLDPTTWCVAVASDAAKCPTLLAAYRVMFECQPGAYGPCLDRVKDLLKEEEKIYLDWKKHFGAGNSRFGCKELPLPIAVAHVAFDASDDSLILTLCRSNFYAKTTATDDFQVRWFELSSTDATLPPQSGPRPVFSTKALGQRLFGRFSARDQFTRPSLGPALRFQAKNPLAPSQNELYIESFFRGDRGFFPPTYDPLAYPESTVIPPSLSSKQTFGFRFEGRLTRIPDLRSLGGGRKWSLHTTPALSALFNTGFKATDPNFVKLSLPMALRRTFADKSCGFLLKDDGIIEPDPRTGCRTPNAIRRLEMSVAGVLESTKTGTTKNFVAEPRVALQFRPFDILGARVSFTPTAGYAVGTRLTEVQFFGEKTATERPNGVQRLFTANTLTFKPANPPFGKFTGSVEYSFTQLLKEEIHSSPGDIFIYRNNPEQCKPKTDCVLMGKDGLIPNFAKGSRRWFNAQLAFDLTESLALVAGYRRGHLAPTWIFVEQTYVGVAFHLDPAKRPTIPKW